MKENNSKTKKTGGKNNKTRISKRNKRREIPPLVVRTWYNNNYQLVSGVILPNDTLEGLSWIAKAMGCPDLGFSVRVALQHFLENNIHILMNHDRSWFQKVANLNNLTDLNDAKPDQWGSDRVKRLHEMYDKIKADDNKLNPEN